MKKQKQILVALVMSLNFLLGYAVKPNPTMSEEKLADLMIQKMEADVELTDAQKLTLKSKLMAFILSVQKTNALTNNEIKKTN